MAKKKLTKKMKKKESKAAIKELCTNIAIIKRFRKIFKMYEYSDKDVAKTMKYMIKQFMREETVDPEDRESEDILEMAKDQFDDISDNPKRRKKKGKKYTNREDRYRNDSVQSVLDELREVAEDEDDDEEIIEVREPVYHPGNVPKDGFKVITKDRPEQLDLLLDMYDANLKNSLRKEPKGASISKAMKKHQRRKVGD